MGGGGFASGPNTPAATTTADAMRSSFESSHVCPAALCRDGCPVYPGHTCSTLMHAPIPCGIDMAFFCAAYSGSIVDATHASMQVEGDFLRGEDILDLAADGKVDPTSPAAPFIAASVRDPVNALAAAQSSDPALWCLDRWRPRTLAAHITPGL